MFENLKSLFVTVVPDGTDNTSAQTINENSTVNPATPSQNGSSQTSQSDLSRIEPDKIIEQKLRESIESKNLEGFDYLEFRKSIMTLQALPMDEATKFQSTYATASTLGLTKAKLLESLDYYKKVLAEESVKFKSASKEQKSTNVDTKHKSISNFLGSINEKKETIKRMSDEVTKHQLEIDKLHSEIAAAEKLISDKTAKFEHTLSLIIKEIEDDAEKINKYLK